jgi:phosphatidylglycerol:prolipoprotein diacylglycerol transferase
MKGSPVYSWILIGMIVLSGWLWSRKFRREGGKDMFVIYLGGLMAAFAGAKIVYLLAEGWMAIGRETMWMELATGKTILGALLFGYGGVEFMKSRIGYRKPTGDWFALVVPLSVAVGRLGCLHHGCCLGMACDPEAWYAVSGRWPAPAAELGFNLLCVAVFLALGKARALPGQHFHLYLIGYGVFRFCHEFVRDTPRIFGVVTGYQVAALAVVALGVWGFVRRRKAGGDAGMNVD